MFGIIEWIFFDVGSTLVDEHLVYEHIFVIAEFHKVRLYILLFMMKH